jgi:transposase
MAKRKRTRYTDEFKAEAVKLIVEEGYSISQAARNLDINTNMLCRWKNELTGNTAQRKQAADEKEEIRQLQEEVRQLKLEKEILKKATAFFAKESS